MTKFIIVTIAGIVSSCALFAQQQRNSIIFSPGFSIPVGSYGNKELRSSSSGFARLGPVAGLSYARQLSKTWGLVLTAYGQRNVQDPEALAKQFAKARFVNNTLVAWSQFTNPFPNPNASYSTYQNWKFEKNAWWIGGLLAGFTARYPASFNRKMFFVLKAQAGAVYVESPETKGVSTTDTAVVSFSQSSGIARGFAYALGAGIQYPVGKKFFLTANTDYLGTGSLLFKDISNTTTVAKNPGNPATATYSSTTMTGNAKQSIQSINVSVGIGLKF
jgi:hypothetical protein